MKTKVFRLIIVSFLGDAKKIDFLIPIPTLIEIRGINFKGWTLIVIQKEINGKNCKQFLSIN